MTTLSALVCLVDERAPLFRQGACVRKRFWKTKRERRTWLRALGVVWLSRDAHRACASFFVGVEGEDDEECSAADRGRQPRMLQATEVATASASVCRN